MWKKFKEEKPEPIVDLDSQATTYPESEISLEDILNELSDNDIPPSHIKIVSNYEGIKIYYYKDLKSNYE